MACFGVSAADASPPGAFTAGVPVPTVSWAAAVKGRNRATSTAKAQRTRRIFGVLNQKFFAAFATSRWKLSLSMSLPLPDDRAFWCACLEKFERGADFCLVAAVERHFDAVVGALVEAGIAADAHRRISGDRRIEMFRQRALAHREIQRARKDGRH